MERFLEIQQLLRLTQEEIEIMYRYITNKVNKLAINNLPRPQRKSQGKMYSMVSSTKHVKENTNPPQNFHKLSVNTSQFIQQGQYYPNTKTRQRHH